MAQAGWKKGTGVQVWYAMAAAPCAALY